MKHIKDLRPSFMETKLPTGNILLDKLVEHFLPGELIVIAGDGCQAKSDLMLSMMTNISVVNSFPVCYFCNNYKEEDVVYLNILYATGKTGKLINEGEEMLKKSNLFLECQMRMTFDKVESSIKEYAAKGVSLFMIDSFDYIEYVEGEPYQHYDEMALELKRLAVELKIAIVVIADLDNSYYCIESDAMPTIQHLSEKSRLVDLADMVLTLYHPLSCNVTQDSKGRDITKSLHVSLCKSDRMPLKMGYLTITDNPYIYDNNLSRVKNKAFNL